MHPNKRRTFLAAGLALLLLVPALAMAQDCPEGMICGPSGECVPGPGMTGAPATTMMGMAGTMGKPDPEAQIKAIEEQIEYVKETAQLKTDMQVKRLELAKLMLDLNPSADKINAKYSEIAEVQAKLREKAVSRWLASDGRSPGGMGMCCPMGMGGTSGMGMQGMGGCPWMRSMRGGGW